MPDQSGLESAATRREWIFPILTLDVVLPFYEMMGLAAEDVAPGLQQAVRHSTLGLRQRLQQSTAGVTLPKRTDFYGLLQDAIGPALCGRLAWWLTHILHGDPRDNLPLSDWIYVLRFCRHESERWNRLGLPHHLSDQALERFRASIDRTEFRRICKEQEKTPLSDWDLHMYASQLYDFDEDLEGPSRNPLTTVSATIRDYQGYRFWAWMLRNLSPDERTHLRTAARQIVVDEELISVRDLPDIATLEIVP